MKYFNHLLFLLLITIGCNDERNELSAVEKFIMSSNHDSYENYLSAGYTAQEYNISTLYRQGDGVTQSVNFENETEIFSKTITIPLDPTVDKHKNIEILTKKFDLQIISVVCEISSGLNTFIALTPNNHMLHGEFYLKDEFVEDEFSLTYYVPKR